jgi:hypothetical protein
MAIKYKGCPENSKTITVAQKCSQETTIKIPTQFDK